LVLKNALYEDVYAEVKRFREKWEPKIATVAYRTVTAIPDRGESRTVYLLTQDEGVVTRFWSKYNALLKRIKIDREKLRKKDPGGAKAIDLLLPYSARDSFGVRIKVYVAHSQRKVSSTQAMNFLIRIGKDFPKDATDFYVRSISGRRYKLIVRDKSASSECPLRTWNVILSKKELSKLAAPPKAIYIKAQAENSAWRKRKGLIFLGRNSGTGKKKGKSFLYCRMKKSKKRI